MLFFEQKPSFKGVLRVLFNFIEIELRHGCSTVNLVLIFRTPFPKNNSGRRLLFGVNHLEA